MVPDSTDRTSLTVLLSHSCLFSKRLKLRFKTFCLPEPPFTVSLHCYSTVQSSKDVSCKSALLLSSLRLPAYGSGSKHNAILRKTSLYGYYTFTTAAETCVKSVLDIAHGAVLLISSTLKTSLRRTLNSNLSR